MYNFFDVLSEYSTSRRNEKFNQYIASRNWTKETVDKWSLGYFPANDILSLKVKLTKNGGSEYDLEHFGVYRSKSNKSLFYDRIIFPIKDQWGKNVAITGRTLDPNIKPKYFNTIFEKTKILYGLDQAIDSIIQSQRVYIFEGNADVITAHQHGITNVVCCMGTALTEEHIVLLARYAKEIVIVFDNDDGGSRALKSFNNKKIDEKRKEINIFRCRFNKYKDADEYLNKESKDILLEYINQSISNEKEQKKLKNII